MTERFYYSKNIFLRYTRKSHKRVVDILLFFLSTLHSDVPDPTLIFIYNRTKLIYDKFKDLMSDLHIQITVLKSRTVTYKKHLSGLRIKLEVIRANVVVNYPSKSVEFKAIFPFGLKPFFKGTYYQRLEELIFLKDRLALYDKTTSVCPKLQAIYDSMTKTRDLQTQAKVSIKNIKAELEVTRVKLSQILFGNCGLLMDLHQDSPEKVRHYFPQKMMRKQN